MTELRNFHPRTARRLAAEAADPFCFERASIQLFVRWRLHGPASRSVQAQGVSSRVTGANRCQVEAAV